MVSKFITAMFITTLLMGCGNNAVQSSSPPRFAMTEIPATITGVENRREYLAMHYWDRFDFSDAEAVQNDSIMGIAVSGYIGVLLMNKPAVVERSISANLGRALQSGYDSFERVTSKLEDYLYNPNSPMRNEELYLYVLRYTTESAPLEDIYKIRPRTQLELCLKNRVGEIATNFDFESRNGQRSNLHAIESPYTILFFNTPDCDDCARVKGYIANSPKIGEMVKSHKLTILAIYAEGDMELWRKAEYPSEIINGADTKGVILEQELYDLKALPTLYLLDGEKRVILKDRTVEEVTQYLAKKRV